MKPETTIEIRLCLFTALGYPAGARLERGPRLPVTEFHFPDTPAGRAQAEEAKAALQEYVSKNHDEKRKRE